MQRAVGNSLDPDFTLFDHNSHFRVQDAGKSALRAIHHYGLAVQVNIDRGRHHNWFPADSGHIVTSLPDVANDFSAKALGPGLLVGHQPL